jgi:hypothetical protein
MASQNDTGDVASLPPEAVALAGRMYDAARSGEKEIFEQALPAGLPPNLTNEKGDTLVCYNYSQGLVTSLRVDTDICRESSCLLHTTAMLILSNY